MSAWQKKSFVSDIRWGSWVRTRLDYFELSSIIAGDVDFRVKRNHVQAPPHSKLHKIFNGLSCVVHSADVDEP
jgi:hypothetical protein